MSRKSFASTIIDGKASIKKLVEKAPTHELEESLTHILSSEPMGQLEMVRQSFIEAIQAELDRRKKAIN